MFLCSQRLDVSAQSIRGISDVRRVAQEAGAKERQPALSERRSRRHADARLVDDIVNLILEAGRRTGLGLASWNLAL